MTDRELLARYAATGSAEAFDEIARRHTAMVYSACRRILGEAGAAEDACQATFLVLLRKGRELSERTVLSGWLFRVAEHVARNARRTSAARQRHEKEAAMNASTRSAATTDAWGQVRPRLDAALAALPGEQRDALVLRYLRELPLADAAREAGCPPATMHTRTARALERLRRRLGLAGPALSAATLGDMLAAQATEAVPSGLAANVSAAALAGGSVSIAALELAEVTMKAMLWLKVKLVAAVLAGAAVVAGGGGALAVKLVAAEAAAPAAPVSGGKLVKGKVLAVKVSLKNPGELGGAKWADISLGSRDGLRLGLFLECKAKGYTTQVIGVQDDKCQTLTGGRIEVGDEVEAAITPPEPLEEAPARTPPAKLNQELVNLPANTWVKIKPDRNPEGRAFSGVCWGNGLIYYFGGGHGSYVGNDVELYDVAANTWTQSYEPEDWREADKWPHLKTAEERRLAKVTAGGSADPMGILSPKGRPLTYHTYQYSVWFPEEGAFYTLNNKTGMWSFDPVKKEWREETRLIPEMADQSTVALTYDPGLKTVVLLKTTRGAAAYAFDRQTRTWTKKCDFPKEAGGDIYTAYDPGRKVHVVDTRTGWFTLDLAAGTAKPMKDFAEAVKTAGRPRQVPDASMTFDPDSGRTLIVANASGKTVGSPMELWAHDAAKDEWTEVKMQGAPPAGDLRWGLMVYDPDHKCCLLLNVRGCQGSKLQGGPVDGLYAFRLRAAP